MSEHLTKFMSGSNPRPRSTISQVAAAEGFDRKIAGMAAWGVADVLHNKVVRRVDRTTKTIEKNLAHGNFRKLDFVRRYIAQYKMFPPTRKYLEQVIDQFRKAEFNMAVGRELGALLKLKKAADVARAEGKSPEEEPIPEFWETKSYNPQPTKHKAIIRTVMRK